MSRLILTVVLNDEGRSCFVWILALIWLYLQNRLSLLWILGTDVNLTPALSPQVKNILFHCVKEVVSSLKRSSSEEGEEEENSWHPPLFLLSSTTSGERERERERQYVSPQLLLTTQPPHLMEDHRRCLRSKLVMWARPYTHVVVAGEMSVHLRQHHRNEPKPRVPRGDGQKIRWCENLNAELQTSALTSLSSVCPAETLSQTHSATFCPLSAICRPSKNPGDLTPVLDRWHHQQHQDQNCHLWC